MKSLARPGWIANRSPHMVALAALVNLWCLATAMTAYATAAGEKIHIVAFGDSLTAGYMLPESAAFPAQLEAALKARGHDVKITNAGVSGDTTAAGLERLEWSLPEDTDAVILELGANDALRGLDPKAARANLDAIIGKLKARGLHVLVAGMAAPRGLGEAYVEAFDPIYRDLADKHGLLLYPFFLDGVAEKSDLNLLDGLHPNAKGVAAIVEKILPKVEELIARARAAKPVANSKS